MKPSEVKSLIKSAMQQGLNAYFVMEKGNPAFRIIDAKNGKYGTKVQSLSSGCWYYLLNQSSIYKA